MSELRHEYPNAARDLTHGWRNDYGRAESLVNQRPQLVLIDDDHQPKQVTEAELERRGLGHIVMASVSSTIVQQRKPPMEEAIPKQEYEGEPAPRYFIEDTSYYLG